MSLRINTNVDAQAAHRHLSQTSDADLEVYGAALVWPSHQQGSR